MTLAGQFIQLAILANLGVYVGCRFVGYELETPRKIAAGTAFALIYSLPLGVLVHLLAPLALWKLLEQPMGDRKGRGYVMLLTYCVAGFATVFLFYLTHPS
jgi:hypothetical protein